MKTLMKLTLIVISALSCLQAKADGTLGGGGGDVCENNIRQIVDDIGQWISRGGGSTLHLPRGISAAQYSTAMQEQVKKVKVNCVGRGDTGYPVFVRDQTLNVLFNKTCKFEKLAGESLVTCDAVKLGETQTSDQYILLHHELAGLAQLELPDGAVSHYEISNQIAAFLEDKVVKRLVVKTGGKGTCLRNSKQGDGTYICKAKVASDLHSVLESLGLEGDSFAQGLGQMTTQKKTGPNSVRVSIEPRKNLFFRLPVEHPEGLFNRGQAQSLKPQQTDILILDLEEQNGKTLVKVNSDSIIGGVPVKRSLEICDQVQSAKSPCADFEFSVSPGAANLYVHLTNASSDLKNDQCDAATTIKNQDGVWLLESMYGNGKDSDDINTISVGDGSQGATYHAYSNVDRDPL
jgi:hypothetical protein